MLSFPEARRRSVGRNRGRLIGQVRVHGDVQGEPSRAWAAVFESVRQIPRGRVMTYGQIATSLGSRLSPRAVGWALHGSPGGLPWHRVVNASGGCSTDRRPDIAPGLQRSLLESEGVRFRRDGTLDLERYRFLPSRPRDRRLRRQSGRR
jgi:methylated-DNA-protein-cysteine methyltransferase related protein